MFIFPQTEKHRLKEKALEEEKLQKKASISVPLVDEHSDDVQLAHKTAFTAKSSVGDKKRKRLEIRSQSVFSGSSFSKKLNKTKSTGSSQAAKIALLKACTSGSKRSEGSGVGGGGGVRGLRNSLGIRPRTQTL